MSETPNLALPLLAAGQAQKHVTVNEALRRLDVMARITLKAERASVPNNKEDGEAWLVADGATGLWSGWDGDIAVWWDGAWARIPAREGWRAWIIDEAMEATRLNGAWRRGLLAASPMGAASFQRILEEELFDLSGPVVETAIAIPARAIVLCVSTRTSVAITGASSYDCGIDGQVSKFGGSLGAAAGSSNLGVIWPEPFWSDTPVRLSANGGDFTGGAVRVAIHYWMPEAPA